MGGGYQPIETWAIMVEDWCSEALVRYGKPARPENALLKRSGHGGRAMNMQEHVRSGPWHSLLMPERADHKSSYEDDENEYRETNELATGFPVRVQDASEIHFG